MRVAVIFGGNSTEHDISCLSAASVLRNINKNHEVLKIGITREGKWFVTDSAPDSVENGTWENGQNIPVVLSPNDNAFLFGPEKFIPDVVFPVLHGKNGEDGTVQGLLEMMGMPYVGSRVLGTAVCMDKAYAKIVFEKAGIAQAEWITVERCDFPSGWSDIEKNLAKLEFPVFVKPSNAGSSFGVTKCDNVADVRAALENAFGIDRRAVIESGIKNPVELEVAVYGNSEPVATVSGRIFSANEIYDYNAKYVNENSETVAPSGFDREDELRATAVKAYKACDCKGLARVDFLVDGDTGRIYLNEINTIPGFTSISMYPKLCEVSGLSYGGLIEKLFALAVDFEKEK